MVAQPFTAGEISNEDGLRPVGTRECRIPRRDVSRPSGTEEHSSPFLTQR
jgi:hypothetical protein